MERSSFLILVSIIAVMITLVIGISFWNEVLSKSEEMQLLPRITDVSTVVVSDRVPLGCFIPPDITEEEFNKLKRELDEELFEFCFKYNGKTLNWNDIKDKLKYGLKVDGYCYAPKYASCMGLSEVDDDISNRRSIDFGREAGWRTGYSYITGQPSIIVVKTGEEAHITLYGSAYFKKAVIDSITARVLNSTHPLLSCQSDCSDEYNECKSLEKLLGIFQNCKENFNNCKKGCEYGDNHIEELNDCPSGNEYHGCSKYYGYLSEQPSTKLLKIAGPIKPDNYTIVNLGDINLGDYRGLLWGSQTITFKQPANNCYNPIRYECYYTCCEERDKEECELECSCSTDIKIDSENTFMICRNFCISKEGYYKDTENITRCIDGCEWASRHYDKPEYQYSKKIDLVFVVDTSGSMCQKGSDEWGSICSVITNIIKDVEKEDYQVDITLYGLGKNGEVGSCKTTCASTCVEPNCRYKVLNCNDINSDLGLFLDCNNSGCYTESWGPGAEWVVKNHQWNPDSLSKVLFVVGDEGPYCGGGILVQDYYSVEKAKNAAIENDVTIFGLWGIGVDDDLKGLFKTICKPKGTATAFDTTDTSKLINIITSAIKKDIEFETGYNRYLEFVSNSVPSDTYILNKLTPIFSSIVYIVDWDSSLSDWTYPYNDNYNILKTPKVDKFITTDVAIEEVLEKI